MLEILTPMNKIERVSRKINSSTFVAAPGIWGQVEAAGSLKNVVVNVPSLLSKLVISSASSNVYESHDVSVGRITTAESIGIRVKVDSAGYTGTPTQGRLLAVSDKGVELGKLFDIVEKPNTEVGTYEMVARCEEIDATTGYMIYRTISPTVAAI